MKLALCGDTGLSLALDQLDKKGIMANIIFSAAWIRSTHKEETTMSKVAVMITGMFEAAKPIIR